MKQLHIIRLALVPALFAAPAFAEGIPQMDQTWFANQLLWLAVSFFLMYLVVAGFVTPAIRGLLETRATALNEAISAAEDAKRTAGATRDHFESEGQSARTRASEIMAKMQAETSAAASESLAKLDRELATKLRQADARIADATADALDDLEESTTDLAASIINKLLGRVVDRKAVSKAVNDQLKAHTPLKMTA